MTMSTDRAADHTPHAAAADTGESSAEQPDRPRPGHDDAGRRPRAETRTRAQYADAMRHNGAMARGGPGPSGEETVTHFHGEFKGRPLDLYTDGARWAAADTPRREETAAGKGDIPDLPPTGEEFVDSAGEDSSRLERFRRKLYDQSDDAVDIVDKNATLFHEMFSPPPTGSYEGTPLSQPHISGSPRPGIDAGTMATALFTAGLVIDRAVRWVVGHYEKHGKG
jgi:hypothetical protein